MVGQRHGKKDPPVEGSRGVEHAYMVNVVSASSAAW